jgi:16S rRNA (cytosine967-C5)-methyltransferase
VAFQNPREIACLVLQRREARADYVENLLAAELERAPLKPADRALAQELAYGAVRWRATLDWLIARKTDGRTQKAALQILLRLGLYQLFWLDRVPDHAAVNESVELAKRLGFGAQAGFINAVLRGCLREYEAVRNSLDELKATQPHLGFSHPEWLVQRWCARWGDADTRRLLEWNNAPPKTFARVNALKADAARLLTRWREQENVDYDFGRWDWIEENSVFELKQHRPLNELGSFRDGWFYVQDPSTLLAITVLDSKPGETVLDLCAAPGGKTTLIAQFMRNEGRVVAHDSSEDRLKLVKENCVRLGVTCVQPICHLPSAIGYSQFDRILLDAPCSNTGVLRRRVDLRWRIRPEEITRLAAAQLELLKQAAPLLKPGGTLVYSTCSLEPEENAAVVKAFLAAHPAFALDRERELIPFKDHADGGYVARLGRV